LAFSVCALLSKIKDIVLPSQGWLKCKHEYIDITNGSLDTVQDNQFLAFNQNNFFAHSHIQISCDIIITTWPVKNLSEICINFLLFIILSVNGEKKE